MIGSAWVARFETREEFDAWRRSDPHVTGNVRQDIQIMAYRLAPHYDFPPCPKAAPNPSREQP
jgi:hypothetical protein